jgi:ribulose-phosphate 3-epimerase
MRVIPAVNCQNFSCVENRMVVLTELASPWAHLDVADGRFSVVPTWNNPEEFAVLRAQYQGTKFQIHLMVERPEEVAALWFSAGADEVVLHCEALRSRNLRVRFQGRQVRIGIRHDTAIEDTLPFLDAEMPVLILAVPPGLAGYALDLSVIEKAKMLRERFPHISIEVDGGVTRETIPLIRECADMVAVATAIFNTPDPARAYRELCAR